MLKTFNYLSLIILLGMGCSSCKDENDDPMTVSIPQGAYDYAYFKTGTWWVYKDSISGDLDTVYVTESNRGTDASYHERNKSLPIYEWFQFITYSTSFPYKNRYFLHTSFSKCYADQPCHKIKRSKSEPGEFHGENIWFLFDIQVGFNGFASMGGDSSKIKITSKKDSLQVGDKMFYNVVEVNISYNLVEDESETVSCHAKNIGVVKMEIKKENKNWQLIAWNIVQ